MRFGTLIARRNAAESVVPFLDLQIIIGQFAVLFIIIALGFTASKLKALPQDAGKVLTKIALNITLPCTILNSVVGGDLSISGSGSFIFILLSFLVIIVCIAVAIAGSRLFFGKKGDYVLYACMIAFSNAGFMGFPMCQAIFGSESAFYVALFNIPFNIIIFAVCPFLIAGKGGKTNVRALVSPTVIAAICVIPLNAFGIKAPGVIADVLRLVGSMTTPCTMIIIGITLAQIAIRDIFSQWRLYPAALMKLILIPVVVWLIFSQFVTDGLMLGVLVAISAMPSAAILAMFAIEYKGNERAVSGGIFITTLLSGATIPLVMYFLFIR